MSLLGGAIALGGSLLGSRNSRKAQNAAQDQANLALNMQLMDRAQQQQNLEAFKPMVDKFAQYGQDNYNRYTNMFGSLEDTLNDYYMNLNPDEYASQSNQALQQQYQQAMNQVNSDLAARGITNSGVGSQMNYDLATQMAQGKAQNIMDAPHQVAQQQQGWLNYGTGRMDNAYNQMASGFGAQQGLLDRQNAVLSNNPMSNNLMQQSGQNYQLSNQYGQQAGDAMAGFGSMMSSRPWEMKNGKLVQGKSAFDKLDDTIMGWFS
jgi:hypothetical protein